MAVVRPSSNSIYLFHILIPCLGFIGSHVIDQALKAGFRVRAAARDANKGAAIKEFFEGLYPGQIEYVVVPDMAREHAYMEAVKGML